MCKDNLLRILCVFLAVIVFCVRCEAGKPIFCYLVVMVSAGNGDDKSVSWCRKLLIKGGENNTGESFQRQAWDYAGGNIAPLLLSPFSCRQPIGARRGLSYRLWRLLYRAFYIQPDARHAERQAGEYALYPSGSTLALRAVPFPTAAKSLRQPAAQP